MLQDIVVHAFPPRSLAFGLLPFNQAEFTNSEFELSATESDFSANSDAILTQ